MEERKINKEISKLREEYSKASLNRLDLSSNPLLQFEAWLNNAYSFNVKEPNAVCVSTVNNLGQPSSRMVLLRGFDENGFVFYTNYLSKKGVDIQSNNKVAMLFFWQDLQQQIRIEGACEKINEMQSDEYFASRPLKSQAASKASPQSTIVNNRKVLDNLFEQHLEQATINKNIERPAHWGGFCVKPNLYEFWQGRPSRLHDRFQYVLNNNSWNINRLAP